MSAQTTGGLTLTAAQERAVINKYTLVPVTAVIATAVLTGTIMHAMGNERDRILVLETKMEVRERADQLHTNKLDTIESSVRSIHDDLLIIKTHLGIGDKPSLGRSSAAQ